MKRTLDNDKSIEQINPSPSTQTLQESLIGFNIQGAITEKDLTSITKFFYQLIALYEVLVEQEGKENAKDIKKVIFTCRIWCCISGVFNTLPERLHEDFDKLFPYTKLEAQWILYFDKLSIRSFRLYPDSAATFILPDLNLTVAIGKEAKREVFNDLVAEQTSCVNPIVILDGPPDYKEYEVLNSDNQRSSANMIPNHYEVSRSLRSKSDFEAEGLYKVIEAIEELRSN